ncbi:hypothetical protein PISMIDRAFT_689317 [Pisolithus microcarpus 441]|uniref:Uncharacterized protein n=1 Tax=Pisolithus microcarpus 441 TaxID=765257 RepID=A0A0C9YQJ1_9AGAM|nr:hypothetical protein PISMIDRAFT_689317 [Pisolithus microcarpus 441]
MTISSWLIGTSSTGDVEGEIFPIASSSKSTAVSSRWALGCKRSLSSKVLRLHLLLGGGVRRSFSYASQSVVLPKVLEAPLTTPDEEDSPSTSSIARVIGERGRKRLLLPLECANGCFT